MHKNTIIITGGAGFVGSNLISLLLSKTKFKIISIDNYSTGSRKNHIRNSRIKYVKGDTKNIAKLIKNPQKIVSLFLGVAFIISTLVLLSESKFSQKETIAKINLEGSTFLFSASPATFSCVSRHHHTVLRSHLYDMAEW